MTAEHWDASTGMPEGLGRYQPNQLGSRMSLRIIGLTALEGHTNSPALRFPIHLPGKLSALSPWRIKNVSDEVGTIIA